MKQLAWTSLLRGSVRAALALLVVVGTGRAASGAVLSLDGITRINTSPANPIDLTATGTIDWAYWAPTASGLATPVVPTNEKLAATVISGMDKVGGTSLRGSTTATTVARYSWADGTSPASGANASLAGLIFDSDTGTAGNGKGVSLTLTGDPNATRVATLYFGGFGATGTLTLTLNGATTVVDASQVFASNTPKQLAAYTVSYKPDSAGDLLTVQYTASNVTDAVNAHVGAQAVTVSVNSVPEPGTIGAGALGGVLFLGRRHARRPTAHGQGNRI